MPDGTEKDKEKALPPDFYTGLNYLGKPASVSVQGESPTASAAGATPTGALGVGPTATGGPTKGTAAGATGGTPSTALQTALEALGLTKNVADIAGTKSADSSKDTSAAGAIGANPVDTIPSDIPVSPDEARAFEHIVGGGRAGTEAVSETGAGLGAGAAAAAVAAQEAAKLAGAKIPKPVTAGEAALNVGPSGLPTSIGEIVTKGKPSVLDVAGLTSGLSGITSGIESAFGFGGKPPAMAFPSTTWSQISSQVSAALPPPLTVPAGATPEQSKTITEFNTIVNGIRDRYGSPDVPAWVAGAGPQSAETWGNILPAMTKEVQGLFDNLSAIYPKVAQAMKDASTPAPSKAVPKSQVLPGGFYGGSAGATPDKTKKLPETGQ